MKYTKFIAVGAFCAVLPSCALVKSALSIPGSLLGAVGRTAGLNVKNEEAPKKTELEKQEEEENKIY